MASTASWLTQSTGNTTTSARATSAASGAEGGGKMGNLPTFAFPSDDGSLDAVCPTEIGITDRREAELSRLGLLPLCHMKGSDYAVFCGAQTLRRPERYHRPEGTANAAVAVRLPFVMATDRFMQCLQVMARDKIGSFMEIADLELWLNRWIQNYVNPMESAGPEMRAKHPLREARVEVVPAGERFRIVAHVRPWLPMEKLTTSMRVEAWVPTEA